jgi:RNA polymerase sigma factor for flagellar operon FliA
MVSICQIVGKVGTTKLKTLQLQREWQSFKETGSKSARNNLAIHYSHLVKYQAERLRATLPSEALSAEDLFIEGILGLFDALDRYDSSRGIKFETYSAPRIRGAMVDALREYDWHPRLVNQRVNILGNIKLKFEMEYGRPPTEEEIHETLISAFGAKKAEKIEAAGRRRSTLKPLSSPRATSSKRFESERDNGIKDEAVSSPEDEVGRQDFWATLLKPFNRSERLLLTLYYREGMTMREIGATLDLSESRVSQMHTSILERLKSSYTGREEVLLAMLQGDH